MSGCHVPEEKEKRLRSLEHLLNHCGKGVERAFERIESLERWKNDQIEENRQLSNKIEELKELFWVDKI